jgi:ketosteroid isomerase-like protein
MTDDNLERVRQAYDAYARGDLGTMLEMVDPGLEWTYLDPSEEDPAPRVCHGRGELEAALERRAERGLTSHVEEILGNADRVMVVTRTPGIEAHRVRHADERDFSVLTLRGGRIVALRDCRDRDEAVAVAGIP